MIDRVFLLWFIYYIYVYGLPPTLLLFAVEFNHFLHDFFIFSNKQIYPEYWDNKDEDKDDNDEIDNEDENDKDKDDEEKKDMSIIEQKYEDKYLIDVRKMNKDWVFTEEENIEMNNQIQTYLIETIFSKQDKIKEMNNEIENLKKALIDDDKYNIVEQYDVSDVDETTLEEINEERNKKIIILQDEIGLLENEIYSIDGMEILKREAQNIAEESIINKKLEKLVNCFVIEKTPLGNVLMIYKKETGSFHYYSDCNIPYRYLEVVSRKYVKTFHFRPLYIDMEEELKLFEEKWENNKKIKDMKELESADNNKTTVPVKKNVFAKFKSYNKDVGTKMNMAVPPKNSIPNKKENKENEKILLKENSNRYTYEGKFANFNFLQKIERKVFNKKLGLSYADFKKSQI